jgi:outer membrane lipoprotein carrier protein
MKFLFVIFLLSTYLNTAFAEFLPTSFSANFSQEYVSSLKGKMKKGDGTIDYKFPSNIRFETNNPTHVIYVTNGSKAWYYTFPFIDGEKGELTESSAQNGSGLFTKFFDSLKNGLKSNNLYDVKKENNKTTVLFKDKTKKEIGVKLAVLTFKTTTEEFSTIESIDVEFLDSKKSLMKLSNIKLNPNFESNKFSFTMPLDSKKNGQKN